MNRLRYQFITQDLFDVASRLKEIDAHYVLYYNLARGRYEVHCDNRRDSYAFTVPYDALDCRTLEYARRTRAERMHKEFEEMERQNAALEGRILRDRVQKAVDKIGEGL